MMLDRMLYLVVSELGMSGVGPIILEVELSNMSREQVTKDLREGQYEKPLAVIEINVEEKICREVTDEFRAVIDRDPD